MKEKTNYKVTLPVDQLAGGGFSEKLQKEFEKVFENIHDPNTGYKDKRTVTAKFIFEPDEDREIIKLTMDFTTALAKVEGLTTRVITDKDLKTNTIAAQEFMSNQRGQTYIDDEGGLRADTGEPIDVIEKEEAEREKVLRLKKGNE